MPKFNTKFNPPPKCVKHFTKPSLTDQSQAYDADINNIVNGMSLFPNNNPKPAQFGLEFNPNSYNDALNLVANAKSEFAKLPSNLRREFDNDPKKFVQFIDDSRGDEILAKKGIKLGIFNDSILENFKTAEAVAQPVTESVKSEQ